jgi:hypothetical protein
MQERLKAELAQATAELRAHMATWEYAFAMAGGCHGGRHHPVHWATHARTEGLTATAASSEPDWPSTSSDRAALRPVGRAAAVRAEV